LFGGIDRQKFGPRTALSLNRQIPHPKAGEAPPYACRRRS
jgi:hypothetical protein